MPVVVASAGDSLLIVSMTVYVLVSTTWGVYPEVMVVVKTNVDTTSSGFLVWEMDSAETSVEQAFAPGQSSVSVTVPVNGEPDGPTADRVKVSVVTILLPETVTVEPRGTGACKSVSVRPFGWTGRKRLTSRQRTQRDRSGTLQKSGSRGKSGGSRQRTEGNDRGGALRHGRGRGEGDGQRLVRSDRERDRLGLERGADCCNDNRLDAVHTHGGHARGRSGLRLVDGDIESLGDTGRAEGIIALAVCES